MIKTDLWTSTQVNNFFGKELRKLLKPYGFIDSFKRKRYFVKARNHFVQVIFQEIIDGISYIQLIVAPAFTYQEGWFFFGERINLDHSGEELSYNDYSRLAIRETTGKAYYKINDLISLWNDSIVMQIQEEVISRLEQVDFREYQIFCEEGGGNFFHYGSSNNSVRFYAAGYNCIWQQDYERGEYFIKKGLKAAEELLDARKKLGGDDPLFNQDYNVAGKILEILQQKETGWENLLEEKLNFLEKDALEKVWGISLDDWQ